MARHAFLVVLEVDPIGLHHMYSHLPHHCTIMHWFRTGASVEQTVEAIAPVLAKTPAVELRAGEPALFGPNHDVPVHLIEPSKILHELHLRVLSTLSGVEIVHTEPSYTAAGFHPHVTTQSEGDFPTSSKHVSRHASIIEAHDIQRVKGKEAVVKIELGTKVYG